jgi:beta-lactamase class A
MRHAIPAAIVALALLTPSVSAQQDAKASDLHRKLVSRFERVATDLDGVMGYTIVDLTSGDRIERLGSSVFATASTIKLAILYELFKQADEGTLRLDEALPLDKRHVVGGTGILAHLTAPSMPLRDYATLMVMLSDNTATNVVIDTVGMEHVTARMAGLGLKETKLRRRMIDMEAARRGDENVSTPGELAGLLEVLYRGDGLRKESHDGLLAILQKPKDTPMRRGVPATVRVANKPGTLEGVEVDAGIVYLPGRPYIFAAMTTYLKDNAAGEAAIASASQAAFEYFSRLAKSSEYGRAIR